MDPAFLGLVLDASVIIAVDRPDRNARLILEHSEPTNEGKEELKMRLELVSVSKARFSGALSRR